MGGGGGRGRGGSKSGRSYGVNRVGAGGSWFAKPPSYPPIPKPLPKKAPLPPKQSPPMQQHAQGASGASASHPGRWDLAKRGAGYAAGTIAGRIVINKMVKDELGIGGEQANEFQE